MPKEASAQSIYNGLSENDLSKRNMQTYRKYLKRPIDIALSLLGIVLLSPLFLVLAIWIKLDSKGPVFFRQKRIGRDKTYFNILKFRTMRYDTPKDVPTHMMTRPEEYITRAGHFLRKSSMDELPQLWNILIGHMSVVGPRPALWNQVDLIAERDRYGANNIRPGLTGWAQINGRDELEISEKAKLDGEYARNIVIRLDATCFLISIAIVLRQKGIIEGGTGALVSTKESMNKKMVVGK